MPEKELLLAKSKILSSGGSHDLKAMKIEGDSDLEEGEFILIEEEI